MLNSSAHNIKPLSLPQSAAPHPFPPRFLLTFNIPSSTRQPPTPRHTTCHHSSNNFISAYSQSPLPPRFFNPLFFSFSHKIPTTSNHPLYFTTTLFPPSSTSPILSHHSFPSTYSNINIIDPPNTRQSRALAFNLPNTMPLTPPSPPLQRNNLDH